MQAVQKLLPSNLLTTRTGTLILGGLAALLAAIGLLVYLSQYRASVGESAQPMKVLVARGHIAAGTPGEVIKTKTLSRAETLPATQLREGAVFDLSTVEGRVATKDIAAGQQLTTSDFTAAKTDAVATRITNRQRAIAIPLDSAHGLTGVVRNGDHVDVYAGFNVETLNSAGGSAKPVLTLLMQNALVLKTEKARGGSNSEANIVLRAKSDEAAKLAFASDNGKLWIVARPQSGARGSAPGIVTVESLLLGVKPLRVLQELKKNAGAFR